MRGFYRTCANGVELLGLDVTVYGLRRGRLLDPFDITVEASDPPADATANCVFFGSWSSRRNLLSLDAGDDRVHLSGRNSVAPQRTWRGLGELLVETLDEQLRFSWDADGRRVGNVGADEDLGDPLFVDLAEPELAVFTAMHGAGNRDPQPVARSLRDLMANG